MPYQIFISFKNLNDNGIATEDSKLAGNIYEYLTQKGLNVFFSNVSLMKLGTFAYSKAIDDALDSSQILIAVGTSQQNLESPWVRYEWDSFFNDIRNDSKSNRKIFVYTKGMATNELPRALRQAQTFEDNDNSLNRLYNFIQNSLSDSSVSLSRKPIAKTSVSDLRDEYVEQHGAMYDIFISYAREDAEWTRHNLYGPLSQCTLMPNKRPRIYFEDSMTTGSNFIETLHTALTESKFILPVYSVSYFSGAMCNWELQSCLRLDPTGEKGIVKPILLSKEAEQKIPFVAQLISYIDTSNTKWFDQLVNQLGLENTI